MKSPPTIHPRPDLTEPDTDGRGNIALASSNGPSVVEFRCLSNQLREAGLLDYRPWYYALKIASTVIAFAAGWALFVVVGDSWLTLPVAVLMAALLTQVVFLGHDAGHYEIARSRRVNRLIGLFVEDALAGLSFGWWVPKHNAHHAHPNQVGRDPDLGTGLVAFSVTSDKASGDGLVALRQRFEGPLFVLVLILQGVGLHVTSVQSILRRRDRTAIVERCLIGLHAVVYLGAVFWVLSPLKAVAFIAIQQGLLGLYLGCTFAPNHKGMPLIDGDADLPFVVRQVITARNLIGGRFTTFMFGGLNYQIEHHLFPSMPRPNLVRAQPFVRAFCAEHDLPYREERPLASYREVLHHVQPE